MVSNTNKKINFYLRIIQTIRETGSLPKDLSPQQAYYYTKPLKDSKLIGFRGSKNAGIWFLTDFCRRLEGKDLIKKTNLYTLVKPNTSRRIKNVRGHGFGFRIAIPKIANWHKRFDVLKSNGFEPELLDTGVVKILLDGNKTHLGKRSIVMHFDSDYSFVAESAQDSFVHAIDYFIRQINKLEDKFKISFKIKKEYKLKCFRKEFGHLENILSKKCHVEGRTYMIRRENGSIWFKIDFSNHVVEGETTDPETSAFDMDTKIKPLFDEIDRNPRFISETKKTLVSAKEELDILKRENRELKDMIKSNAYLLGKVIELSKDQQEAINYIKEKLHR